MGRSFRELFWTKIGVSKVELLLLMEYGWAPMTKAFTDFFRYGIEIRDHRDYILSQRSKILSAIKYQILLITKDIKKPDIGRVSFFKSDLFFDEFCGRDSFFRIYFKKIISSLQIGNVNRFHPVGIWNSKQ